MLHKHNPMKIIVKWQIDAMIYELQLNSRFKAQNCVCRRSNIHENEQQKFGNFGMSEKSTKI